ncbi:response regulator receiver [Nitrosococcus halophilus Nc 4]|uniref:Response regulator receiver n=1 Tax=Nitrosococcus halophilus (strain Nc4) TaxID=472759 RepID=D5BW14_NITHN|nr:response regulator transcription factor [Nitrosococcus halophilus]ADE13664.1 response regulator receiver [Nitrosococcus halophilus Nc 4]
MRVLLVEDDRELQKRLHRELTQQGFVVDTADNGVDAEFLGFEEPYEAVILDLGLPQRSGLDVLRHWRDHDNRVPVLILTARDAWHEKVEGFKCGADDYLSKPFHTEELLARLQALIRRSQNRPHQSQLTSHSLTLDEERQCVHKDGHLIELTGTEFRLLRYFMLHPGRILSKSRLTEQVYALDADKDSNVMEVYVNRLRKKVGSDLIKTRRGQGYIFGETEHS